MTSTPHSVPTPFSLLPPPPICSFQFSSDGASYGDVSLKDKTLSMNTIDGMPCFELPLDNVAQCVVPANNANELEIHFPENDGADKDEDGLIQITMHFPPGDDDDEETPAQALQKEVLNTGVIKNVTGDIIAEFSKDQGNFVAPRGKYGMQMLSTYMHLQGTPYSYKIKYTDVQSLFLLDKPDGLRMAFIVVLDKPIRHGSQKYPYLVLETHKIEHTIKINLTEEEIARDYDGALTPEMTMPMASLIAKIFKVLSQKTVFVPKQFKSFRDEYSVRCTVKTNEGLIYPLAKCIIFINKPTIMIKYEDIETVEFQRLNVMANSATRSFDMEVLLKKKDGGGESKYVFASIDRSEHKPLTDFLETRSVKIISPPAADMDKKKAGAFAGMDGGGDDDDDDEEGSDDGDYKSGQSEHSDSDDSGSDEEEEGGDGEEKPEKSGKSSKKRPMKGDKVKASKGPPRGKGGKDKDGEPAKKKAKKVRDKTAPKGALSAFMCFVADTRASLKEEHPEIKTVEVARECGILWRALAPEDKEQYEEMAKLDKERYAKEMGEYNAKQTANMEIDDDENGNGDDGDDSD